MKSGANECKLGRARFVAASAILALLSLASVPAGAEVPKMLFSISGSGTIGGVPVENEDLLLCDPVSTAPPVTECNWSLFLDGSLAGLTTKIKTVDMLPNGNLVMRVNASQTLPDLGPITNKDLVLFIPSDPLTLPYTSGEWRLFMDGTKVKDAGDSRAWDSTDVITDGSCEKNNPMSCDVLLSIPFGSLGGLPVQNEDVVRCHPTAWSVGGAIEACDYSIFLDSSALGVTSNVFAIDLLASDTLLFRVGSGTGIPDLQPARDIVRYVGTFGESPVGTLDIYFDGSEAGLAGETVESFAVVPDFDDDDVPDGIDNCPNDPNPGQEDTDGDGIGDVCDVDPDCFDPTNQDGDGDGVADACDVCPTCFDPTNTDTDGDGECDVCDYCPFRPDPDCRCGDSIVDPPSETCDLGDAQNGQPGSLCSATCHVVGKCTGSGTECETADDCPPGEGCCGNSIVEGDEECDDGNSIPDDLCDNSCILNPQGVPILGCEDVFGPHLVSAFVRSAKFRDTNKVLDPGFDKWKSKGDFNLGDGQSVDPDSEVTTLIFSQAGPGTLYTAVLPPGSFVQSSSPIRPTWKFLDKEADVPGAEGWKKARFFLRLNKIKNNLAGETVAIDIDTGALGAPPVRLRQTIRIGDDCATTVLSCEEKSGGKLLKCNSTQTP